MEIVSVISEDILKGMNLKYWHFNYDKKSYEELLVNDSLLPSEEELELGDYAVFVHKEWDDPTMKYLSERRYWLDRFFMFINIPDDKFDKGTYCGKYLTMHNGHTNVLLFVGVKHIYSVRNYWRVHFVDGDVIDVPKGETKWAFHVKRSIR